MPSRGRQQAAPTSRRAGAAVLELSADQLIPDPNNANRGTDRGRAALDASLEEFGAGRSVTLDRQRRIISGNKTVERYLAHGGRKVLIIPSDGSVLVAHQRTDLDLVKDPKARRLAYADNRVSELDLSWDPTVVMRDVEAGIAIGDMFTDDEFKRLFARLDGELAAGKTDPEAVPARRPTDIRVGDLFTLGRHRLLCGDSTDVASVERVMQGERARLFATDPPYLVDYDGTNHPQTWGDSPTKNKDWSASYHEWDASTQGVALYEGFIRTAIDIAIHERAAWYCWHAFRRQALLEGVWEAHGAFAHQQIIWVKTRAVLTRSVYLWQHEPCFFGWLRGKKPFVQKGFDAGEHPTTVWQIPSSEVESTDHPTSKPTRCFSLPMQLHTGKGETCYEPFSGSGSQIMAAEQTGRVCYAIELSPQYVQVAIDRWEAFTGKKAAKVGEARIPRTRAKAGVKR